MWVSEKNMMAQLSLEFVVTHHKAFDVYRSAEIDAVALNFVPIY